MSVRAHFPIRQVVIYTGHQTNPLLGPYAENVRKRVEMFEKLNAYRKARGREAWKIVQAPGENLIGKLQDPKHTLLVIPAGQSTHLDKVFSFQQLEFLKRRFFEVGGRGYLNCGSAYWASKTRVYSDLCTEQPTERRVIVKKSQLPLFKGTASGPLCPYSSPTYKVGFFSDAVTVTSGKRNCTILLSGGGSFHPAKDDPDVQILARYPHSELIRYGKSPEQCSSAEIAAILVRIKKGAAILSMFHPYYSSHDLDPERYERAFPGSGTNWRRIVKQLSSEEHRLSFVLENFLFPLEDLHQPAIESNFMDNSETM